MITKLTSFLYEMGFSEIQIEIYKYLLTHKYGTINDIKRDLNYSYTQVYNNLLFLEEKGLIESSSDSKPKLYIRINPKMALTELINIRYSNFQEKINRIDEEIKIQESKFGRCVRDVSFYHYSDILLGINNLTDLIENAEQEIIITSLPPSLIKRLEPSLYEAYMNGVEVKLYFSQADFETIHNYFEEITNILRRIRIEIIQTEQKACRVVRYNDKIVNSGNIFIDNIYLNSIVFHEDEILQFDGFVEPNVIKNSKKYLEPPIKTIVKRIKIDFPEPIQNVLNIIRENKSIKTRDLSSLSKIGGAKLREILNFLIDQGVLKEKIVKENKAGRPKREYILIDEL
ncbi:MAG: helix-turn-helix domain-containing protein [Promethearchaeota archaeon]